MSMRISSALLSACLLVACGEAKTDRSVLANAEAEQAADADDSGKVMCSQQGRPMARECTVEQTPSDKGLILTLRHPDGAFHRLLVTRDGRGVIAADGAQTVKVSVTGTDGIEVALGGDRYQLPATVKGSTPAP